MRTEKSIKNIFSSIIGQFFGIIVALITRMIFVRTLSKNYLGVDGLFSNILTLLSLIELGVGPAMTFSLYKPLKEQNQEKIKSLINLYKKLYIFIGSGIFVLGLLVMPFLKYFIANIDTLDNIYTIYFLYLLNASISYFFSYKSSILITDQKKYIYNLYHYICFVIYNVFQIIVLILCKNYILFLCCQIAFCLIENILLVKKTDKLYPYLKEKNVKKLDDKERKNISKNIKAMFFHKLGAVIINATDNIILSKYVGIDAVALYSNYLLITNNIKKIVTQIFDSVVASIGNLAAEGNIKKELEVFKKMFFFNYYIYTVICSCLIILFNDFIGIWVGNEYQFAFNIVFIISLNFYLSGTRKTVLAFRDAMGLYWYDRYKPVVESILNIVASILLAIKFGTLGVLLGTLISNVFTNLWIEPLVLFKYGFHVSVKEYYLQYVKSLMNFLASTFLIKALLSYIFVDINIVTFVLKGILAFIAINVVLITFNFKKEEFIYYKKLFLNYFRKARV